MLTAEETEQDQTTKEADIVVTVVPGVAIWSIFAITKELAFLGQERRQSPNRIQSHRDCIRQNEF